MNNNKSQEEAYAYYRYSSHNQDGGNSIDAQRTAVRKYAKEKYIDDMIIYAVRECIFSSVNTDELLNRLNEFSKSENKNNEIQIDVLTEQREDLSKALKHLIGFIKNGNDSDSVSKEIEETEELIKSIDERIEQLVSTKKQFTEDDLVEIKKAFVPYVSETENEDTLNMIDDIINKVEVDDDIINVKFKDVIKVNRDTKRNFN